jgi:REP element-mobilizing transposase RayT
VAMARPLRIEFPGAIYHITFRGNAKQSIYFEDKDFKEFLMILSKIVTRYHWFVHSYCLMNNHYHLLVETPEGNLSAGMRQSISKIIKIEDSHFKT